MTQPSPQDWVRAYARIQSVTDRQILAMLRQSLRDINADLAAIERAGRANIGDTVRIEQMRRIKSAMLREQAEIFRKLGEIVPSRRAEAAARAIALGVEADSDLFKVLGRQTQIEALRRGLTEGLNRTIEVAVTRMTQSQIPLAERIYRTQVWMGGRVDKMVNSALARGLTPRQFAAQARDWFSPDTPGGVRYAALRLARTEINNAYHAISVNAAAEKPWVEGMKWNLSGSHPKADVCDELAHEDKFNMGEGVFPPGDVPRKPHPQCLCVVVPALVEEDEFFNSLLGGKYDDYLARKRASLGEPGRGGQVGEGPAKLPGLAGAPLDQRAAQRAAARARQKDIEHRETVANLAADIDAAVARGLGQKGIEDAIDLRTKVARANQSPAIDDKLERSLRSVASIAPENVMRVVDREASRLGLRRIGNAGSGSRFDPDLHETFGGTLSRGQAVTVLRRGYTLRMPATPGFGPEDIPLFRARVELRQTGRTADQKAAIAHARKVMKVDASASGSRATFAKELTEQAKLAPRTMTKLKGVEASQSKAYLKDWGPNNTNGAQYLSGRQVLQFNPSWVGGKTQFDLMQSSYTRTTTSGWHVPSARPGLQSTLAHEFGHHVHWTMNHGDRTWYTQKYFSNGYVGFGLAPHVADELLPVLSRELGVSMPRNWSAGQPMNASQFDNWVKARDRQLRAAVSEYGTHSGAELLAEIWSEYSTSGTKARPHIRRIGAVMRRIAEAQT